MGYVFLMVLLLVVSVACCLSVTACWPSVLAVSLWNRDGISGSFFQRLGYRRGRTGCGSRPEAARWGSMGCSPLVLLLIRGAPLPAAGRRTLSVSRCERGRDESSGQALALWVQTLFLGETQATVVAVLPSWRPMVRPNRPSIVSVHRVHARLPCASAEGAGAPHTRPSLWPWSWPPPLPAWP